MTNDDLIREINNFTEAQKSVFNRGCKNKLYTEEILRLSTDDMLIAEESADMVNSMHQSDIDNDISPSISVDRKLSSRPC
jgi:hypothetical protein